MSRPSTPSQLAPPSPRFQSPAAHQPRTQRFGFGVPSGAAAQEAGANGDKAEIQVQDLQQVVPLRQFGWRRKSVVTCPASPLITPR